MEYILSQIDIVFSEYPESFIAWNIGDREPVKELFAKKTFCWVYKRTCQGTTEGIFLWFCSSCPEDLYLTKKYRLEHCMIVSLRIKVWCLHCLHLCSIGSLSNSTGHDHLWQWTATLSHPRWRTRAACLQRQTYHQKAPKIHESPIYSLSLKFLTTPKKNPRLWCWS